MQQATRKERRIQGRIVFLAVLAVLAFVGFSIRLYQIQIVHGAEYASQAHASYTTTLGVAATRGEIVDSNLESIVVNDTTYSVTFDYNYFPHEDTEESSQKQNVIIATLIGILSDAKEKWNDTLPLSSEEPYTFAKDRETSIANLKTNLRLAEYATAEHCMLAMIEKYHLEKYSEKQQRQIAGIRYEMELREFSSKIPFTFASSISKDSSYTIQEQSTNLPGVSVSLVPVRKYLTGKTACHLIGTVGLLDEEEYASLKDSGYSYNDVIGKSGVEQAAETALRGVNGVRTLWKDDNGKVIKEEETQTPIPGDSVVLTLDLKLQRRVESSMQEIVSYMKSMGGRGSGNDIKSASAVVLDLKDNAVLACASWPNYDINSYYDKYGELINDPGNPLFNRALDGGFAPGSTFKPAMAVAAMNENLINTSYTFYCGSWYNHYASQGLRIHCMANHGNANVVYAIGKSCNCFFCEMGRILGIERMNKYCRQFGMGVKTGIEIGESEGVLAGPEEREEAGGIWVPADSSQAAIGQSDNMITPIQLATYVSTIANRGTRYSTHLIKSTISYDGNVHVKEPEVACKMDVRPDVWDTLQQGMLLTATNGTATRFFVGAGYRFAAKTGTAEAGNGGSDHGVFIGYAPVENPTVAIAVLMENGTATGSGKLARKVMDAYFETMSEGISDTPKNTLLS
ncbi:MAG: penicillin-binding protein [Clostridia bacterium]|nr:penicillin-binding protein [Clostridia bacterium]